MQYGAIWDLLTSQCDRHSENIFIDESGNLQFIDNDKALGVVSEHWLRRAPCGDIPNLGHRLSMIHL